jgi:hypothetical protein
VTQKQDGRSPSGRAVVNGAASVSALRASVPSAARALVLAARIAGCAMWAFAAAWWAMWPYGVFQ